LVVVVLLVLDQPHRSMGEGVMDLIPLFLHFQSLLDMVVVEVLELELLRTPGPDFQPH
jgi:hypothetical protein